MKKTVPLVVGNWKLNPVTMSDASDLAQATARKHRKTSDAYVAIAPPATYLAEAGKKICKSTVSLAAQDVSVNNMGAHTGEVSIMQLRDLGVEFVIIGHSERRAAGETNEEVQKKTLIALKHRLVPIVCIGERERDDQGNFFTFIEKQLRSLGKVLTSAQIKKAVIAYEPIWAIGTGDTATADDVKEMQLFIESVLTKIYDRPTAKSVRLLYGGSVKPGNAAILHTEGGMKGFLVGGASLKVDDFAAIVKAVS
ncbi:MAG: triose-phosphate isomerase [Candidatus Pacebacteria bacterium]|nr:triose-phosphate isomerase [Candidatus Paceibacterota bacterium]